MRLQLKSYSRAFMLGIVSLISLPSPVEGDEPSQTKALSRPSPPVVIDIRPKDRTPDSGRRDACAVPGSEAYIFCDDFESEGPVALRYFEHSNDSGDFVRVAGVGVDGSAGMQVRWQRGEVDAGSLKRSFGRLPPGMTYPRSQSHSDRDFREIYWRIYMRNAPGWTGLPDKISRALIFASDTSWANALLAHVWSSKIHPVLKLDPASGIDANGRLATTTYNDFPNLTWLGARLGTTAVFAPENADRWFCIEAGMKLNSPGAADGMFRLWIDNHLETERTDLNWLRTWNRYGINAVFIENYWNDGAPGERMRFFDNFAISTQRIGCLN